MKYQIYKLCFLLFIFFHVNGYAQENNQNLRIGLIADIQYADKDDGKTRFYRASLDKLDDAIKSLNQDSLNFTAVFGDFVDEGPKDLEPILSRLKKLKAPFYGLLGNHDYPKEFDSKLYQKFGMENDYYAISKGNWHFIFLNSNELSSYAVEKGSKMEKDFLELESRQKALGRENVQPWNGGISRKQMTWLKKEIIRAERTGKNIIVFSHHPILPENGLEILNNQELLKFLVSHRSIKAVLSGHHHTGNFVNYEGLPLITLEGMVETKDQNAYGILEIADDHLEIKGFGRLVSRLIEIR